MPPYTPRKLVMTIIFSAIAAITVGMIMWIKEITDMWYILLIIGVGFVFSVGTQITKYFMFRNKIETSSRVLKYPSDSAQSNIYQPMTQSHISEPYDPKTTQNPDYCIYCGARLKPKNSFCENCGKAVGN